MCVCVCVCVCVRVRAQACIYVYAYLCRVAQIFQKSGSHLKIQGVIRIT